MISNTRSIRIVVAVNGHRNIDTQKEYLKNVEKEFGKKDRIKIIKHLRPVGVAQLWNEIVIEAKTPYVLILNDDIRISSCFWPQLVRELNMDSKLIKINGIWSHFLVNKVIFEKIGYFDETFTGIGFEDFDFEGRMWVNDIKTTVMSTPYVKHDWVMPKDASYEEDDKVWGKYSCTNERRFLEKWKVIEPDSGTGLYLPQIGKCIKPKTDLLEYWPS